MPATIMVTNLGNTGTEQRIRERLEQESVEYDRSSKVTVQYVGKELEIKVYVNDIEQHGVRSVAVHTEEEIVREAVLMLKRTSQQNLVS
jgi:hypothetical protein